MILIYVPCKDKAQAQSIGTHLLAKKLIACANIVAIQSLYQWKGKLCDTKEYVVLMKTTSANANAVEKEVKKLHSYHVPCIMRIPVRANTEFEKWMKKNVKNHL